MGGGYTTFYSIVVFFITISKVIVKYQDIGGEIIGNFSEKRIEKRKIVEKKRRIWREYGFAEDTR
jgi:hypothetical protein